MVGHVDAGLAEALRVGLALRRERVVTRGRDHGRGESLDRGRPKRCSQRVVAVDVARGVLVPERSTSLANADAAELGEESSLSSFRIVHEFLQTSGN
jgi:hypothetical protein